MRITLGRVGRSIAALVLMIGVAGQADAGQVIANFQYSLGSGGYIAGTVRGDYQANSDLITGLTGLNAIYSGRPGTPFVILEEGSTLSLSGNPSFAITGYDSTGTHPPSGSNTTTFAFGFTISHDTFISVNAVSVGNFGLLPGSGVILPLGANLVVESSFVPDSYLAAIISTDAVPTPEPSTLISAGVAGLVGFGYVVRRRKAATP